MFRFHTVVITADALLRQTLRRLSASIGATVAFVDDASSLRPDQPFHLVVCDARAAPPDEALQRNAPRAPFLFLLGAAGVAPEVRLLDDERAVGLLCVDGQLDEDEFVVSATKLLRGEIFGAQKYLPWGVTTFAVEVRSYAEKERALGLLADYAVAAGCRGPLRDRIQRATDELMMNALYHAPVDGSGRPLSQGRSPRELTQMEPAQPILLQYACSGRTFSVSVQDGFGSLRRERILEYLCRAESELAIEDKPQGAGLGLLSVLAAASRLVFNLDPGRSTEVIALFDRRTGTPGRFNARSLYIFTAPAGASAASLPALSSATTAPSPPPPAQAHRPSTRALAIVTVALAVATLIGALSMRRGPVRRPAPPAASLGPAPG